MRSWTDSLDQLMLSSNRPKPLKPQTIGEGTAKGTAKWLQFPGCGLFSKIGLVLLLRTKLYSLNANGTWGKLKKRRRNKTYHLDLLLAYSRQQISSVHHFFSFFGPSLSTTLPLGKLKSCSEAHGTFTLVAPESWCQGFLMFLTQPFQVVVPDKSNKQFHWLLECPTLWSLLSTV